MKKVLYVMEFPFTILRDVSCPIVEEDRWNKYWLLLSSVGAPSSSPSSRAVAELPENHS